MCEKAEMALAIAIRSNGVVEQKSVVVVLFYERFPSNTISVKLPYHQWRLKNRCHKSNGKKRCEKCISEAIRDEHATMIWWKGSLFRDFENFNLLHLETRRTREKRFPAQSSVVVVTAARESAIAGVWWTDFVCKFGENILEFSPRFR
jgi:hypothetical protein